VRMSRAARSTASAATALTVDPRRSACMCLKEFGSI
jgi:hypothetical protein